MPPSSPLPPEVSLLFLALAAFLAGGLNAVAGGGTFLTFPALVFSGLPPIAANATSAAAVMPGYVGGVLGSYRDLAPVHGLGTRAQVALAGAGGAMGGALLLFTPAPLFRGLVPWLLLVATVLFAAGPRLAELLRGRLSGAKVAAMLLFVVSAYGGYFNGGVGILFLSMFSLLGLRALNTMNALKNLGSLLLSTCSLMMFAAAGLIVWREAAIMAAASGVGGYIGARFARRLRGDILRMSIVCIGLAMTVLFFYQQSKR